MAFNETPLFEAKANHIDVPATILEKIRALNPLMLLFGQFGRIYRGGSLYVTHTHLVFNPHHTNLAVEMSRLWIPLQEIKSTRAHQRKLTAILTVSTVRGIDIDFVCWSRSKVIAAIKQAQQQLGSPGYNQPM
ncbi:hypothetical protein [Buchananella hordeovulneris]|uniref:hypothetical protein n=1 Tax=Buchananella hordeovulneris TaxID=52770 RepID=UPI001FE27282|nr:hypothetical protein [Buchananella hordeovulneris]MDO5079701.1 hypothetical protein [Buchananella hordeovulneris]